MFRDSVDLVWCVEASFIKLAKKLFGRAGFDQSIFSIEKVKRWFCIEQILLVVFSLN